MTSDTSVHKPRLPLKAVAFGVSPWIAAYVGAYVFRSAPVAFALYHVLCLSAGADHGRRHGPRHHKPLARRGWLGLALAGLMVCAATYGALGALGAIIQPARVSHALRGLGTGGGELGLVALFAYFAVVNPVAEELFWRGTVYVQFRSAHMSVQAASVASAILFGSWHWLIIRLFFPPVVAVLLTIGVAAAGYFFARVYDCLHSVPALVLIHGLGADVPILIALWFGVLVKVT